MALSSRDDEATALLAEQLIQTVRRDEEELTIFVPYSASEILGLVYGRSRVLKSIATERGVQMQIQARRVETARIRQALREALS